MLDNVNDDSKLKLNVPHLVMVIGVIAGVFGAFQSVAVLPYQVKEHSEALKTIQSRASTDREILIRIEEQVKQLRVDIKRKGIPFHDF